MTDFSKLGLPQPLLLCLQRMNFTTPTPIQAQAIPVALKGRDILGSAQTGTGKTGAFGIPLIERLMTTDKTTALVMTPTRELAAQVLKAIREMLPPDAGIRTALLIGGESMYRQLNQLKGRPRLVVGTPGRINDHLERRSLQLRDAGFLVLDETDRMLDMGFGVQIDRILKHMPKERQTLLFSATLPKEIVEISKKYLHMPERIAVGDTHTPMPSIKQEIVRLNTADKYKMLLAHLAEREGSVIVFVKTKHGADRMATRLSREGHSAEAIHGDLKQSKRDRVIADFRQKEYRILVATDVAARGLDIPHIEHVINYDLPQVPEDYIHRIGRTARAGAKGEAVCFVTPEDGAKWKAIYHLMNPNEKVLKGEEAAESSMRKRSGPPRRSTYKGNAPRRGDGDRAPRRSDSSAPRRKTNDNDDSRYASEDRPRRKPAGKPFGNKQFADKKFGDRKRDDRDGQSEGARKPSSFGAKRRFEERDGAAPAPARAGEGKPFGKKPGGSKPFGKKPAGKSFAGKPSGPAKDASSIGDRPRGKPAGSKMGKFARKNAGRRTAA